MHLPSAGIQHAAASTQDEDELETIQALLGKDFPEIARIYLRDSAQRLQALHTDGQAADRLAIEKIAHVMCGSAASIGASGLARHCRDMEIAAQRGRLEQKDAHLLAIHNEYARIEKKLTDMIEAG